jgi:hypothetical protein
VVIWRTSRLRELFRPATEIHQDAEESRQFDVVYFAMLVLSCLIALLGLLLNSPAVIIIARGRTAHHLSHTAQYCCGK